MLKYYNNFKFLRSYRVIRGLHFTSTPCNFPQKNLWLNSMKRAWMSGHGSSSSHSLDIIDEDMSLAADEKYLLNFRPKSMYIFLQKSCE